MSENKIYVAAPDIFFNIFIFKKKRPCNSKAMKSFIAVTVFFLTVILSISHISAQNIADSLTDEMRSKILNTFKHFTFDFYIDAYENFTLNDSKDTSSIVPFSSNCPVAQQTRLNVAALEIYYNAEKVRGKFSLQYGDAPNLLASANYQWINTIRQANFGFRIVKNLWIDFGYIFNPVGYESSWCVLNQISFVTVGGYFEPGSVLGAKLSYKFSEKFSGGIMVGDPFSIAYAQNTHKAGIMFFTYTHLNNLSITYNNFFGNQALKNAQRKNNILYNNLIVTYDPVRNFELVGQLDFGAQSNSQMAPDTNETASMFSGFIQASYTFNQHFSVSGRYEFLNDPDGFLTGVNALTNRGLRTNGFGLSFEYKPVKIGFLRLAYRNMESYPGSLEFYSNTSDVMQSIIITTGVRF